MEDEIKSIVELAIKNGYSQDEISNILSEGGFDQKAVSSALTEFETKKKSPSQKDLEDLRLESEQKFFASDISSSQPREAAVELYNAVVKGNLTGDVISKDPARYNALYNVYRQTSSDPSVRQLPSSLFDESGAVNQEAFSRLRRDSFRQLQYQIDRDRKEYEERESEIAKRQESRIPVLSPLIDGAESILGGVINLAGEVSGSETLSEAGSYLLEDVQLGAIAGLRNSGLTDEQIQKGFLTNIMEGEIGTGLTILGPQLLQQIPQLALIAATGGTAGISVLGASSAGSALESVEKRKDMTSQEKMLYGVGAGLAEALSERLFMGDIRMLRQALGKSGVQNLSKEEIKQSLFASVPQSVRSTLEEGVEEAVASVVQQGLLNVIAGDEINPIEIAESAVIGSIMGGSTYLLSKGVGAIGSTETLRDRAKVKKDIQDVEDAINDPDITEAERSELEQLLPRLNDVLADLQNKDAAFYSKMTEEDRTELLKLKNDLTRSLRKFETFENETLKAQYLNTIKDISSKIKVIEKKYDRQEEAGVPSPVVEGEAPVEAQPVEGTGQEAPEAGGVLQVPVEEGAEEVVAAQETPAVEVAPIESPVVEEAPVVGEIPVQEAPTQVKAPIVDVAELRSRLKNWDKPDAELNEKKQVIEDFISLYNPGDIINISAKVQQYKDGKPVKGKFNDVSFVFTISDDGKDADIRRIESDRQRLIGSREDRNINGTLKTLAANKIFSTISGVLGNETATIEVMPQTTEDKRMNDLIARSFTHPSFPIIPSIRLKSGKSVQIKSGITEDEFVSYLMRGRILTNDGIIKISDIESVTGDGALVARKKEAQAPPVEAAPVEQPVQEAAPVEQPVKEAAPTEEVVAAEEVSDEENQLLSEIELNESKIVDLREFEIPTEKSNYDEEVKRIKEEIAKVRTSKVPADDKRDLIDDLKAQIEDARESYENVVETYKDEIKALKADIKKAQKRLDKIREKKAPEAAPVQSVVQKIPEAVSTSRIGRAMISQEGFRYHYPQLFSFLNTGEIYRRERAATDSRSEALNSFKKSVDQILSLPYIEIDTAKNLITIMSRYKPKTKSAIDKFNTAYIQAEKFLADMQKASRVDYSTSNKSDVIKAIMSNSSFSQKQKDVLVAVVETIKPKDLFFLGINDKESNYTFSNNALKISRPYAFIHEVAHWGYFNVLSAQDRIDYMKYVSEKFLNKELTGMVFPNVVGIEEIDGEEFYILAAANARDDYQEYFANQFEQWYVNQVGVDGILLTLYNTLKEIVDNLINRFKAKGYNPDLVRNFEKIVDVTKYDGNKKQDASINEQLLDNLNTGDEEFGNPGVVVQSITERRKIEDLDIKQEDWKDRAKKSWRSFWWSDEQRIIRTFKESLNSQLSRESFNIRELSTGLNTLLNKADKETLSLVSSIIDGTITPEGIEALRGKKNGELMFNLSNAMREYIDSFSLSIILSPAFSKLTADVQKTIFKNLGLYLRGTYRFWKDKRFFPGEKTVKAAIEDVYNQMYSDRFNEIVSLFDVTETQNEIASLEKTFSATRDKIIEQEKTLPAGEKTPEISSLNKILESIRAELKEKRDLFTAQKKLMQELIGTSEITDENINEFLTKKDTYVSDQIDKEAPKIKSEAKDYIKAYLEEAKKIRESDQYKSMGMVSPSSIKVPDKQFKRKLDLPDTFKALLGEEKDPVVRFIDTAVALSNIKYKGDMVYKIATQFKGTEFIKIEATKAEVASGEYRLVTDKFSPLNGKYVKKDVFDAITDRRLYDSEMAWFQTYLNVLLLARKSKVIYNIPTWRKNLTGGWWTMMANGVINPEFISDLGRRGKLLRDKRADPETEALLDIMAQYGLLGQGVNANLIGGVNAMYERAATGSDMDYLNSMERLGERVKGFDQWLGDKYASVDDYTKLVVFRNEINSFSKKLFGKSYDSLTKEERSSVHEQAAERVKQSTPTFSRLPPIYYKIAQLPLGDFISFEFEAFRSFTANFANGYLDIQTAIKGKDKDGKELSSEQKAEYMKSGTARLMGTAAVFGMRAAIPTILAGMALGDDDELEDDIKALRPNWMEGHSIIPTALTKDGIATTYDYSMEDPYGTIFDVVTDPLSFPGHMTDMLNPNMAVTFLFNLYDSKDIYGKEIANSYDSPFTKAYKYGGYTLKSLILPPFATSAVRDELRRQEVEAERYSPLDAVGRVTSRAFIRDYTFDVGTQIYYFGQQFATKKEQYTDLNGIARRNRLSQLDEVRKMYQSIVNIAVKKENYKLHAEAVKNIKRQFKPAEEAYILTGYEIPEQE